MGFGMAILLIACVVAPLSTSTADVFTPSHSCFEPSPPFDMSDEWQVQNFLSEVDSYRSCIQDFVDEQQRAARKHSRAADDAIDDWNLFASSL